MRGIMAVALLAMTLPVAAQTVQERLPTCLACPGEKGQSENADVPSLGGQQKDYVLVQLYMFREEMRAVDVVSQMAKGLSDDDLRTIAETVAKLPPPAPLSDTPDAARAERAKGLVAKHRCHFCRPGPGAAHRGPDRGFPAQDAARVQVRRPAWL